MIILLKILQMRILITEYEGLKRNQTNSSHGVEKALVVSNGRIHLLELDIFKSYNGNNAIGSFKNFMNKIN